MAGSCGWMPAYPVMTSSAPSPDRAAAPGSQSRSHCGRCRVSEAVAPRSFGEAAAALAGAAAQGRAVRFTGGGTKLGWAGLPAPRAIRLQTGGLDRVLVN